MRPINPQIHDSEIKKIGRECGKNAIFQVAAGTLQYLADLFDPKYKTRIVFEYDPEALNWTMEVFTDKDAPLPSNIR